MLKRGVILQLAPKGYDNPNDLSLSIIRAKENESLRVDPQAPRTTVSRMPRRSTRETTAPPEEDAEVRAFENSQPYLEFRFDQSRPSRRGIVFGTASDCDVRIKLDNDDVHGISRHHCTITFDSERRLIVQDFSSFGTAVMLDDTDPLKRKSFKWIIGGDSFLKPNGISLQLRRNLTFQLRVPQQNLESQTYIQNVQRFLNSHKFVGTTLPLEGLDVAGTADTRATSTADTPSQAPIYLRKRDLGDGAFCSVKLVWNVSTGRDYAGKTAPTRQAKELLEREARLLPKLSHEHIVPFVDLSVEPEMMLVLEFAPFGALDNVQNTTKTFCCNVLSQCLDALTYLHGLEVPVMHRDIKPANILIKSIEPFHIWLADFGFSKASPELVSTCGTPLYKAPEVYGIYYTPAVDIWSLGVVGLELAYDLPEWSGDPRTWTKMLANAAEYEKPDQLIRLIRSMLTLKPNLRLPAHQCLQAIRDIQLPFVEGDGASQLSSSASSLAGESSYKTQTQVRVLKRTAAGGSASSSTPRATQRRRPSNNFTDEDEIDEELCTQDNLFAGNWMENSMCVGSSVAHLAKGSDNFSSSSESRTPRSLSNKKASGPSARHHTSNKGAELAEGQASQSSAGRTRQSKRLQSDHHNSDAPVTASDDLVGRALLRAIRE